MAVADIDSNGYMDLILSEQLAAGGSGTFLVYDGRTTPPAYNATVPVPEHTRMIVEDLDEDGLSDVVILAGEENLTRRCPAIICIYNQPSSGFFGMRDATSMIWALPGAIDVAVGDLDGSPGIDVAVLYSDRVVIYNNTGAPPYYNSATNWTLDDSSDFTKMVVTDIDEDAHDDLILASPDWIEVFYGRSGQISGKCMIDCASYSIPGNQTGSILLIAKDVTGDPRPDLIMAISDESTLRGTIVILAQGGPSIDPSFDEASRVDNRDFTNQLVAADFNADGANDLAVVLYWKGFIAVFYQKQGGTFNWNRHDLYLNGTAASGKEEIIGHGDFDHDGLEDIVLRSPLSISLFFQQDMPVEPSVIPSQCLSPTDYCYYFNQGEPGDGIVDLSEYFTDDHGPIMYEVIYQESPNLVATLNADGHRLDFAAASGWFGVAHFRVSANDLYLKHMPIESNEFAVMVNHVPAIVGSPPVKATIGVEYVYQPQIDDPSAIAGHEDSHIFSAIGSTPAGLSIDANSGLIRWRPATTGNFTITIRATDSWGAKSQPQTFTITVLTASDQPPDGQSELPLPGGTTGAIVLATVVIAIMLISAVVSVSENAKFSLLLLILPLYSKIRREKVLDHFIRGQIYGYIMANPGEHYNAIKQALDITNGSLAHHLRTLEREHFIRSKRFGLYRRFYPWSMRVPEDGYFRLNEIQRNILALCRNQPGVTQKELSSSLNLTPPTINYHIAILAEHGHVSVIRRGRKTHVYILVGADDEAH